MSAYPFSLAELMRCSINDSRGEKAVGIATCALACINYSDYSFLYFILQLGIVNCDIIIKTLTPSWAKIYGAAAVIERRNAISRKIESEMV